jgi:AcrR family transcriptional regulator
VSAAVREAALALMREEGADFTIPQVAARAGVHDATIYRRWGSREALIVDAVTTLLGEEIPIPDSGSLRGDLRAFLEASVAFLASPLGSALVRATATRPGTELPGARLAYWSSRVARVGVIFERAIARGEIPASADIRLASEMLIAPLYFRLLISHEALEDSLVERIANLVLYGVSSSDRDEQPRTSAST